MFVLDAQLQRDTHDVGSFPLSRLLLMNDATYPWLILVPQRQGIREIHHLEAADRRQLWDESVLLAQWMERYFSFAKLNVAALGNVVSQLHLHHVGRSPGDPAWPAPVWGHASPRPYAAQEVERLRHAAQTGIAGLGVTGPGGA